jgi:hypothetical protein
MSMSFESDVRGWDGKSAAAIEQVYTRASSEPTFVPDMMALIREPDAQLGASWLLKKHLENGNEIKATEAASLFQSLHRLKHWEARLHVLQCLSRIRVPSRFRRKTETFLRSCLEEENKFVRAWAYSGLYELAAQFPQYRVEVGELLEAALDSEAASVKARVRKCLAKGF